MLSTTTKLTSYENIFKYKFIYDNKHIFFSLIISQFFLNEPTQDSANFIE